MTKQALMGGLKQPGSSSQKVSTVEAGLKLGLRIKEVIGEESISSFGRRCDVGESTLRKYIAGASPNTQSLIAIADAANVNIEWLAAGRGPKLRGQAPVSVPAPQAPLTTAQAVAKTTFDDMDRLELAIETVQEALAANNKALTPARFAQVIAISYRLLEDMDQRDDVANLIKMAA